MIKITHLRLESDEELAPEDQDYARGSHISKKKKIRLSWEIIQLVYQLLKPKVIFLWRILDQYYVELNPMSLSLSHTATQNTIIIQ